MTDDETKKVIHQLVNLVEKLGWQMAIEETGQTDKVDGLIIGEPAYIEKIMTIMKLVQEGADNDKKDTKNTKGIF